MTVQVLRKGRKGMNKSDWVGVSEASLGLAEPDPGYRWLPVKEAGIVQTSGGKVVYEQVLIP